MRYLLVALALLSGIANAQSVATSSVVPVRPTATVATLPSCTAPVRGAMYVVTDALTPVAIATVTGGGAVVVGVMCNGSAWIVQ